MTKHTQPSLDANFPALILRIGGGVIHHGALAVARTLGRSGVPVYGLVESAFTPLARTRYLTKTFLWNSSPTDPEPFVKSLTSIAQIIARPAIVIPISDLSAVLLAENAAHLAPWFLMPPVPPQLPRRLANKACLHALCAEIGVPDPLSLVPKSFDDVLAFARHVGFPLLVKAVEQWHPIRPMVCAQLIRTPEQLSALFANHNFELAPGLMFQEYLPGEDWIAHGYYNSQKKISLTFTGRKLRAFPPDVGATAVGLSVDNKALRAATEKLLHALDYSGIIDMDWRRDHRDGHYKLVDCNPRVGQNFRMFENRAGIDVVRAQHLDLSGRDIPSAPPIEGRLFTVESSSLMSFVLGRPNATQPQDLPADLQIKSKEPAWWSADDPAPFLIMIARLSLRVLQRAFNSWRNLPRFLYSRLSRPFSDRPITR